MREPESNYWKETGIAVSAFVCWLAVAIAIENLTGFDGIRVTGYIFMALGAGLLAWSWWRSPQSNGVEGVFRISNAVGGGLILIIFGAIIASGAVIRD